MRRIVAALFVTAVIVGCSGAESAICRSGREAAETRGVSTKEICREADRRQDPQMLGTCDYCDWW